MGDDPTIRYRYEWDDRGDPTPEQFDRVSILEVKLVTMAADMEGDVQAAAEDTHEAIIDDPADVTEIIREHEEMTVIPSNVDMVRAEPDLLSEMRPRGRVGRILEQIDTGVYDHIIIDTPPSLGILTDAALLATENIVIPALAESTSKRALEILFDQIESIEANYPVTITEQAVVANRVEPTGEAADMIAWFEQAFGDAVPLVEIRKRVALTRAWSAGGSIFTHEEDCDMEQEFARLAAIVDDAPPAEGSPAAESDREFDVNADADEDQEVTSDVR